MAKRQITHTVKDRVHTFTFGPDLAPVVFDERKASNDNNDHARSHGWTQRHADAAALDKGATMAQKRDAVAAIRDYYEQGEVPWARKSAAGPRPFDVGAVVTAMCAVLTNGDVDKANRVIERLMARDNIGREAAAKLLATDEKIATEMARIRARSATSRVDADELLLEMETAPEASDEVEEPETVN